MFSRKEVLDVRRVDLGELVADIGKAIPRMVGEDVRLMIVLCARPCAVEIDPGQFQQVILNLVANARDAMPSGGELTVEVSCGDLPACVQLRHGDAKGGSYASVSVRDTGCGMDEAALGRIFEPFYTTKDVGKGTGLGLPMAYGFVQQSGGLIDVVSRPGMGSTFTLYFPLCPAGASPAERAGPAGAAAPQGDETVLVVEDETAVATMMVESLREAGYTVLEAAQANEALEILRRPGVKVDVLISDVIMPGCNGVDLAKEAREQVPALRVLFVSGYPGADLDKRGLAVAAATILTKPCAHEALLRKVREILDAPPRPNPS